MKTETKIIFKTKISLVGSNPTLAAMQGQGPWAGPSLAVACSASACKLRHSVNCCGRERF